MTQELRIRPMTPEISDPAQIAELTVSWPDLLQLPLATREARNQIAARVAEISKPVAPAKLMHRVLALLSPYFATDTPQSVREVEAEDWLAALGGYPEWAVTAAARWWKSDANPDRRKRPMEGDIAARCKVEMGVVSIAKLAVDRFDRGHRPFMEPEREVIPPEDMEHRRKFASEVMARFAGNNVSKPQGESA